MQRWVLQSDLLSTGSNPKKTARIFKHIGALLLLMIYCEGITGCQKVMGELIGVEQISALELKQALSENSPLMLLDIRDRDSYQKGHLKGAYSLKTSEITGFLAKKAPSKEQPIITICYHGNQSLKAAAIAAATVRGKVFSLSGGMQRMKELGQKLETGPGRFLKPHEGRPPLIPTTWLQQAAISSTAFGVKPTYMILSLIIILILRGGRAKDLTLLRRSMIFFLAGEGICALNFLFVANQSAILEIGHGMGMVAMGTFLAWGVFVFLDERVLHFADPQKRCAFQRFCGRCWKKETVACGLQRIFLFVSPVLAIVSLMPLCASINPLYAYLPVFGTDVLWYRGVDVMFFEWRVYPLVACAMFLVTTVRLCLGKDAIIKAQTSFFWGVGMLAYSLFRFFLEQTYRTMPIWSDVWEELTELFAVCALGLFLFYFRRQFALRPYFHHAKDRSTRRGGR